MKNKINFFKLGARKSLFLKSKKFSQSEFFEKLFSLESSFLKYKKFSKKFHFLKHKKSFF